MALELKGKIVEIAPAIQVTDKFKKREFIIDITEDVNGQSYPNFAKLQASQNKCEVLDSYKVGDIVKVQFNVRGQKVEKDGKINYYTNLDAWKIERVGSAQQPTGNKVNVEQNPINNKEDLPF
jgi:Domain of unknown function (DUF3127)